VQNRWFAAFPQDAASDLSARFRGDDVQHDGAWWELYLHQVLTGTGRRVTPHPEVPGTTGRPDFLVKEPDGIRWYLEATTLSTEDLAAERRQGAVVDALNSIESPDFYVCISWRGVGTSSLPTRKFRESVQNWLRTLNPDGASTRLSDGRDDSLCFRWRYEDWDLALTAVPKGPEKRGEAGRTVGSQISAEWADDSDGHCWKSLFRKATRYGDPPLPFVVAVRTTVPFGELDEIAHELADGSVTVSSGHSRLRQVAGLVVAGPDFQPWSVCSVTPLFISNATAARALEANLPWPTLARAADWGDLERAPLDAGVNALDLPDDFRELRLRPFPRSV